MIDLPLTRIDTKYSFWRNCKSQLLEIQQTHNKTKNLEIQQQNIFISNKTKSTVYSGITN